MPGRKHNPADISLPAPNEHEKPVKHAHSVSSTSKPRATFQVPKTATTVITGLFAIGLAFFLGTYYGEHIHTTASASNSPSGTTFSSNNSNSPFGGGFRGGGFMRRGVFGQVTTVNGSSFTVQNPLGNSTTVQTSSATTYTGGSSVSVGDTVIARGSKASSGTFNATSVTINPTTTFSPFGGGTSGNGANTQSNGSST
ncbi:MAG TPA: DUF5666 domain-containing protein [Candidatus Saccharimonadales bacterium]|nr:DUF5666 domain-containing protein [Candidatus Saccharimonadales bacterium]